MAASSKLMISEAERRFPVRIRVAIPESGIGALHEIHSWLDANCGADGWAMTPAGLRGIVNDAVAIYFPDTGLATAFVARWCAGQKPQTEHGAFRFREDEPKPRVPAQHHRSPP
jgi:hypothetical protein